MNRQEALNKIKELEEYVKGLDKKRVRVYIKENAKEIMGNRWAEYGEMDHMPGSIFDVEEVGSDGELVVWADDEHTDYCYFTPKVCVIVEGSLEDL